MPRKPILSAGVALVSAAAIVAAGPSLFAPGSGEVEAAPGSKSLENVHVGYRMTSLSEITLGDFLDALANGYPGDKITPTSKDKYPAEAEVGGLAAATFYLVDKALGSSVVADDYYFRYGLDTAMQLTFQDLTGGGDTPQALAFYYLLHPIIAVQGIGNSISDGVGDYILYPGFIPVAVADMVNPDLGDVVYALLMGDGPVAAASLVAEKVLQQIGNVAGLNILDTPVGSLLGNLSKVVSPNTAVASLTGGTPVGANPANAESDVDGQLGLNGIEPDPKLTRSSFAVDSTETSTVITEKVVDKKPVQAAVPVVQAAAEVAPPAAPTEPSVTPDVATKGNLITPGVGAAAPTVAGAGEDAEHSVGTTATKDQLSEQNLTVNDGVGSGPSTARKAPGQKKASGANLGQRMQDTTNRITGGLQKAGERISNALSGGSQKQTVKKDDDGQQDTKEKKQPEKKRAESSSENGNSGRGKHRVAKSEN